MDWNGLASLGVGFIVRRLSRFNVVSPSSIHSVCPVRWQVNSILLFFFRLAFRDPSDIFTTSDTRKRRRRFPPTRMECTFTFRAQPLLNGRAVATASPAASEAAHPLCSALSRPHGDRAAPRRSQTRTPRPLVSVTPLGSARPGSARLGRPRPRHGPWRSARCPASEPTIRLKSFGRDLPARNEQALSTMTRRSIATS